MAVRDFIDENERAPVFPPDDQATGDPSAAVSDVAVERKVDVPARGKPRAIALIVGVILVILAALAVVAAITTDMPRDLPDRSDTPSTLGY
jgi:hypothetical protein